MHTRAEKAEENRSQPVANKPSAKPGNGSSAFQSSNAIAQRKLQEIVDDSQEAKQFGIWQRMANNNFQSNQTAQLQAISDPSQPVQQKKNQTGLPDGLKSGIENLSGYLMDDVKVHYNSEKPAHLSAHAYAQGTDIHLAPGQEKHLPHEAWHVVQQKQGRVKPTLQMKGEMNINDDELLEKEADVMGAKALQRKVSYEEAPNEKLSHFGANPPVQKVKFEYDGHNLDSEDLQGFAQWTTTMARINLDRLVKLLPFVKKSPDIPSSHKAPMINIIERSTDQISPEAQKSLPIKSTVYGLDKAKGQDGIENVELAYEQGFRDFDAAVIYQGGKTWELFKNLKVDKGIVRIIYKYKLKEFDIAEADMEKLTSITGVHIHTVMLHAIPGPKKEKVEAFKQLKYLSQKFKAKIGLSNVEQFDDVDMEDNLTNVLDLAKQNDVEVSSIQNRISPSAPDERVRQIAEKHGIDYMGFGLQGGDEKTEVGTCSMDENSKVESYDITTDPLFKKKVKELNLTGDQAKRVMLDWARLKGVKVISSSRTPEGMQIMRDPFASDLVQHLDIYSHGNEKVANSSDPTSINKAPFYLPFETYLTQNSIKDAFDIVKPLASDSMWRLLYKHAIAAKDNQSILQALKAAGTSKAAEILGLGRWLYPGGIKNVTALGNVFTRYTGGMRGEAYPDNATSDVLSRIGTGTTLYNEILLVSDGISFEPEQGKALILLNKIDEGETVDLYMNTELKVTYKKEKGDWVRQ